MNVKKQGRATMLFSLSTGYRWLIFIAAVTTIFAILFNYLMPQVIRVTVDSVLGEVPFNLPLVIVNWIESIGGREYLRCNLLICAFGAIIFSILSGICNYISRIAMAKSSESMVTKLRDNLYAHIQRLPYSWHVKNQTGDTIQRCTSDVDVIRGFLSGHLLEMLRIVFLITLSLMLMFAMNVKLSLIALLFIPLVTLYSGLFYAKISKRFQAADEAEGDLSSMVQENFTGVRVVRAFGRQAHEIERFDQKNNFFSSLWIKLGYVLGTYWGVGDFASSLQVMVIIAFGVVEAVNGSITVGEYMLFIVYNSMLVWPVRSLGRILSEMSKTGVSLSRVNEILNEKEEQDNADAVEPAMDGDIVFDNVSFDYSGINPVLKNINFTIKAGTTFGILGGTGSGKSTLMYLIDRLYDLPKDSGKITINGVDIKNIKLDHLRKNIGFVLQEPFLFSKTIKENIGIADDHHDIHQIRYSAAVAAVDDAISEFSQGYDTIVGERGVTLSGGQKQRVAIARMLMQKSPIMIFDDSLSAVDSETDAKIRSSLKANTENATVILISHRITTLMHADQIIVLDDGKVTQKGTHDELANQDGIYKQIYEIQGTIESELEEINKVGGGF
ncbi:MAG: ABC transporter ATP-binding protein [Oscillospiraceae bacterium]